MRAAHAVTAKAAGVCRCCREGVFQPGLANLFEALDVVSSATHSIQVLWDDRMIVIRQCKPIQVHLPVVAGICSHREADLSPDTPELLHTGQIANNDIRSRLRANCGHHHKLRLAVHKVCDLDRLHRRSDGDFSNDPASVGRSAESVGKLF